MRRSSEQVLTFSIELRLNTFFSWKPSLPTPFLLLNSFSSALGWSLATGAFWEGCWQNADQVWKQQGFKPFIAAQICMHPTNPASCLLAKKLWQTKFRNYIFVWPNLANSGWNNIVFGAFWPWRKYLIKKWLQSTAWIALCRWISEGGQKLKFLHNFSFCILLKFKLARHEMNISSKLLLVVLIANGSPRNVAFILFFSTLLL